MHVLYGSPGLHQRFVPYGLNEPDPDVSDVTPVMESAEAQELGAISQALHELTFRIEAFCKGHPELTCRCPFCAQYPHAIDYLRAVQWSTEVQVDFLDHCRPPTAAEFREMQPTAADRAMWARERAEREAEACGVVVGPVRVAVEGGEA